MTLVRCFVPPDLLAQIDRLAGEQVSPDEMPNRSTTIRALLREALAARAARLKSPAACRELMFFDAAQKQDAAPSPPCTRIRHIQTDGSVRIYDRPMGSTDLIPVEPGADEPIES
jgi:hypothetical protein